MPYADFPRWQVKVVMDDNQAVAGDIVFPHQVTDRQPAAVHKCLRPGENNLLTGYLTRAGPCLPFFLIETNIVAPGQVVDAHETGIVAVPGVVVPRIAQADNQCYLTLFLPEEQ